MPANELLSRLATPFTGEELFDHFVDMVYFIKNHRGEYVVVNRTMVDRCGAREKNALIGRTASQVLAAPYGEQFEEQDRGVMQTGQPIVSRLEMHFYPTRDVGWCLTTKLPLRSASGLVLGLVGVSKDLRLPDLNNEAYTQLAEALAVAETRLSDPPTVQELATTAGMSRYQFDRRMQAVFALSGRQWLLKLRIGAAERLLRDSTQPIIDVAHAVGYADQSAFSRQFLRTTGVTPRAYRMMHSGVA